MEVEFFKSHSMGSDYITIDNRSGQYDSPLQDKNFCKTLCNYNYGVGGLYINEIRQSQEDGAYEIHFISPDGSEGYNGGSNVASASRVAKMLGLFNDHDCFTFRCKDQTIKVIYNNESDRFLINFNDVPKSAIKAVDKGYFLVPSCPHFVHMENNVDSLDVITLGRNLQQTEALENRSFCVDFFERTDQDDVLIGRTYSEVRKEIPICGSGSVAIALVNEFLRIKDSDYNAKVTEETHKSIQVKYPGGTALVSLTITNILDFANITLGLPGKYVFKGKISYKVED